MLLIWLSFLILTSDIAIKPVQFSIAGVFLFKAISRSAKKFFEWNRAATFIVDNNIHAKKIKIS